MAEIRFGSTFSTNILYFFFISTNAGSGVDRLVSTLIFHLINYGTCVYYLLLLFYFTFLSSKMEYAINSKDCYEKKKLENLIKLFNIVSSL